MVRFDGGTASPQGDWYFCAANSPRRQERLSRRHPAHARVRDGGGRGACPAAAAARAAARGGVAEIECSLIVKSAAAIAHARAAGLFLVEGTDLALAQQAIEGGGFDLGRITHLIATSRG